MSQLTSSKAGKFLAATGGLTALLILTLLLAACQTDIDANSTIASGTLRPAAVVQTAQGNNNPQGGVPIDPSKSAALVAGATSTPATRPTVTIANLPAGPTIAGATTAAAAAPAAGATTAAAAAAGATTAAAAAAGATTAAAAGAGPSDPVAAARVKEFATARAAEKGDATKGASMFKITCQGCHTNMGTTVGPTGCPNLSTSTNALDPAYIRGNVRNGRNLMPVFDTDTIDEPTLNNLVAFVLSINVNLK
ncbi:MAG: cytochrome c [Chloroflexi bacterium]|uniref:Cytochrome c n=1 Tax=Candidatus Chlorohelix allophototropha TaxID=3003348 RepID=A0A8T7MAK4_9CHLR|nr:cytochrome c [Chloroflexota bacterium]WJW68872.1 cytochrome c [Chloroflexota bacterium L227-S17]